MMEYLKVKWHHQHSDEPIEIYSEISPERWEIRKVEVFRDGSTSFASPISHSGDTMLGEVQIPDLAEINADEEFEGIHIEQHIFDRIWLMSSEMLTLHEPKLVQSLLKLIDQQQVNVNDLVEQAVQQYLDTNRLHSSV
ncbi:MAG: hypothetical protein AAF702_46410 [Chloroflexota bacterium]